jgi:membrane protein implicated in regulation of membrane protease activity
MGLAAGKIIILLLLLLLLLLLGRRYISRSSEEQDQVTEQPYQTCMGTTRKGIANKLHQCG